MVLWRDRSIGYRLSFCGLVISIVFYVIGFSVPYWSLLKLRDYGYVDQTIGLWQACIHGSLTCISNVHSNNPPWMNAARALCSVSLILLCISLVSGCFRNVSKSGQTSCHGSGRHVECCAIIATIIGAVGCIIFAAEFHRIYVDQYDVGHLYWAFGVVCGALGVAGVCGCVMFATNNARNQRRRATTVRARGPNGLPVSIQFLGEECVHIPYFGDVTPDQIAYGASPMQPPSYDQVTTGTADSYSTPPADASDAPPLYEDITKDGVLPPEVVAHLQSVSKENDTEQNDSGDRS